MREIKTSKRNVANTVVTQRIWGQPAMPPDPAQALAGWELTCSLLVKSPTDTFGRIRPERSRPKGQGLSGRGLRRRVMERRAPTQILNAMS